LVAVLKLYCVTPFGKMYARNPDVVAVADAIGRTANAVALKMTNFASLDPTLKQRGMSNHSRLDEVVWTEFFENPDQFFGASEPEPEAPSGLHERRRKAGRFSAKIICRGGGGWFVLGARTDEGEHR